MFSRVSAFVIWSIVAAALVFWALRLGVAGTAMPSYAVAVDRSAPLRGDLSRLFGAAPVALAGPEVPVEAPSRFKLLGVMAPKGAQEGEGQYGLALIAVDGKPAKAYPVGARLDSDIVLQAVSLRTASVGPSQGGRSTVLELPALPPPATGSFPPVGAAFTPSVIPVVPGAMSPRPVPTAPAAAAMPAPAAPAPLPGAAPSMVPPTNTSMQSPDNFRTQ